MFGVFAFEYKNILIFIVLVIYFGDSPLKAVRTAEPSASTATLDPQALQVFATAAELFSVLSTPIRLQVLHALCDGERSVSQMLETIDCSQPNLSQHLNVLYRSGVLAKRKEGTQVLYRVQSERALAICRSVCTQVAIELDDPEQIEQPERLVVH
ncbi:MAG: winged helix-turn-helix transcriptional regulator [Brachymonas sp.]|nr:winged helix-turn-helix transcriptional regulator [Brachymonas sp.]